jgi:hypothetical protein
MGEALKLVGRQVHADVYRALRCVEENELEGRNSKALIRVASLAAELVAALESLLGHPCGSEETDQGSEAHMPRSGERSPTG